MHVYDKAVFLVTELDEWRSFFATHAPNALDESAAQDQFARCYGSDALDHALVFKQLPENIDEHFVRKPRHEVRPPEIEPVSPGDIAVNALEIDVATLAAVRRCEAMLKELLKKFPLQP